MATHPDDTDLDPPDVHVPYVPRPRWWQNWKWWASLAACLLGVALVSISVLAFLTRDDVKSGNSSVAELTIIAEQNKTISQQNSTTLERLDKNQAGIDELVQFVHDIEANQNQGNNDAVQKIYDLLCASDDPIRLAACQRLGVG